MSLTDRIVREIGDIITTLTTGTPQEQEDTLNTYFLRNASFTHPFCRVPSFSIKSIPIVGGVDSLAVILAIYRWYRTLSPKIDINIDSAVFDQRTGRLFVSIRQTFSIWFIPLYRAPVRLTTILQLSQRTSWDSDQTVTRGPLTEGREPAPLAGPGQERARYFITSQEDLYQVNDFVQFLLPGLGPMMWSFWQLLSTVMCVMLSFVFLPVYFFFNRGSGRAGDKAKTT
ncbi:hypothetical protein ACRE_040620 [Hapsidospora chrysogenum ATCC 11550]|uniref:SigF-like NTF2-like domain-containing protein n=1 Tax=Hapsidospora chrysogenum (strain ATCC 11550 / CBS 779.69 / DSM 880 / IAM 14645 / JCM 23072 / IMI 49137) TaxID=857340 RepID=A0A086T704_HAPC1|nr:hypothetical protein ACRE_040620 [Hapsidospora chrysogenum ATCC 11550]